MNLDWFQVSARNAGFTCRAVIAHRRWVAPAALLLFLAAGNSAIAQDVQPPTAPTSLAGTRISSSQVYLTWTASTDNVAVTQYKIERCTGTSCTNFSQVTTSTTVSVTTSGLSASNAYRYRVRAADAAGNNSPYSNIAAFSSVSGDTTAPTPPTSNTATAASSSRIDLSWSGATDNVAVVAYIVQRCTGATCTNYSNLVTLTGSTFASAYSNTGLATATTYRYRVRSRDARGNQSSAWSPIATATTASAGDTSPPTVVGLPTATVVSSTQINLSWAPATDNVGVTGYKVERCQGAGCASYSQIATPVAPALSDTGLTPSTPYSYRVRATDAAGNNSVSHSPVASATTNAPAGPETLTITYDALGRITQTTAQGGPKAGQSQTITYDASGNRTSRTVAGP